MKGIFYHYFLDCRAFLIGSLICFGASALFGALGIHFLEGDTTFLPILVQCLPFLALIAYTILLEGSGRYLEKLQKTHFLNHVLSSGVSRGRFALSLLLTNLFSFLLAAGMTYLMFGLLGLADSSFWSADLFLWMTVVLYLFGALQFAILFPTMLFRSSEKGGLVFGLIVGFGIVFPFMILVNSGLIRLESITLFLSDPLTALVCVLVGTGIYALFYLLILLRLKRGDVC